jgi:membrane-bound lytic murein transglycosylase D
MIDQNQESAAGVADASAGEGDEDDDEDVAATPENGRGTIRLTESEQITQNILDTALELTESAQELWSRGDTEKAIENLDNAYLLIAKVTAENGPRFTQQKEDLRFMISKRITEIYTSRLTKVNGTHREIPLVVNEHVEREIQSFQTVEREFFLESYKRSGMYREEMAKALRDAGLPEDISWLPLIESGFKPKAYSRSRALGLWQFIPSTGYKFGLKRNDWVDERLSPPKATEAAIAYLKELHQVFGDWATVLAAYNCGEGNVLRVIRDQKIDYLDNFWDLYGRLPRETARYYPRFLAVLLIIKDPAKYGFTLDEPDKPLACETVTIEKQVHLPKVAEKLDVTVEELTMLNPELRREATPPTAYTLNVPVGKSEVLLANLDSIPKYTPPKLAYVYHRVRRGETLSLIAMRYRTSVTRIVETNRLKGERMIRVGQKLKIPLRGTTS